MTACSPILNHRKEIIALKGQNKIRTGCSPVLVQRKKIIALKGQNIPGLGAALSCSPERAK